MNPPSYRLAELKWFDFVAESLAGSILLRGVVDQANLKKKASRSLGQNRTGEMVAGLVDLNDATLPCSVLIKGYTPNRN